MQVKKFEAPTIQEALETVKRELGPEAIILQTKKNRKGFGLLSNGSVEVTAAVSERSLQKKTFVERRIPPKKNELLRKMSATNQAQIIDQFTEKHNSRNPAPKAPAKITKTRYIDIQDDAPKASVGAARNAPASRQQQAAPAAAMPLRAASAYGVAETPMPPVAAPLDAKSERAVRAAHQAGAERASMEDELQQLKKMIMEMKAKGNEGAPQSDAGILANMVGTPALGGGALGTVALQDAYEQLIVNGVDKRYALNIVKAASLEAGTQGSDNAETVNDLVAFELMRNVEIQAALSGIEAGKQTASGPVVIALIGPTGVGKTTTVAKIASEALLRKNLKVGLINLDSYKVAAFDQLGTYAKILNVPFRSVKDGEDLTHALSDFRSMDLVLIDTTGRSQRDPASLKEMEDIFKNVPQLKTQLVLSVTTRDSELYDMANRFSMFRPQGIILSKLDEASIYGAIYNVSQKVKLPILYFTTGQRVPEDIEEASRERVVSLIMNI